MRVNYIKIIILVTLLLLMLAPLSYSLEQMKPAPNYLVILVHGIGADRNTFIENYGNLKDYLDFNLGLNGYVFAYDFTDPFQSNYKNAHELGDKNNPNYWIGKAFNDFAKLKGYSSPENVPKNEKPHKIIIIAHSMGGLSSRVYLTSDYYNNDVKKLVTLDTPHLGADGMAFYNRYWNQYSSKLLIEVVGNYGFGIAVCYLCSLSPLLLSIEDIYATSALITTATSDKILGGLTVWGGPLAISWMSGQWEGKALHEMDPESNFIKKLKDSQPKNNMTPIGYRTISARGIPTPHKDLIANYYMYPSFIVTTFLPFFSEYRGLPTEGEKFVAATMTPAVPGLMPLKDGSLLVAVDSSRGEGVKCFGNNVKTFEHLFKFSEAEKATKTARDLKTAIDIICLFTGGNSILYLAPSIGLSIFAAAEFSDAATGNKTNSSLLKYLSSHGYIIKESYNTESHNPTLIELALFDDPITTITTLETDLDIAKYNESQEMIHTDNITPVKMENFDQVTDAPTQYISQAVPITTSRTTEVFLTYVTVKTPVTQIRGVLNDFKPLMMKTFEISENFAAWQDFFQPDEVISSSDTYYKVKKGKYTFEMDNWGNYTISGFDFAEGQNLLAFRLKNRALYTSNQVLKIIQNTIKESIFCV